MIESKPTSDALCKRKTHTLSDIIASHLKSLEVYHRAVLDSEDIEAIHKMRVTTRRLQAAIDLLQVAERENLMAGFKATKLKKQLRRWRRSLSPIRNVDVFLAMIEKEITARRPVYRRQYDLLKRELQERRVQLAQELRPYLEQIDPGDLASKLGLNRSANSDQLSIDSAWAEYETRAISRAADRLEQRLNELQALVSEVQCSARPERVHQLRIAVKRLRYLLEIVSEMGYCDASRALDLLKSLQDGLGDWHDLDAFKGEIIRIVSRRGFLEASMAEAGQMLQAAARLLKRKDILSRKLFPIKLSGILSTTTRNASTALRRAVEASG
jgi:CHAD domain-containing protein